MKIDDIKDWAGLLIIAWGVLSAAGMWVLSRSFSSRKEVEDLARKQDAFAADLAAGRERFAALESSIREVSHAAGAATQAAQKASAAADKIHHVEIGIATLSGEIHALKEALEPLKRFSWSMVDGHLDFGREK